MSKFIFLVILEKMEDKSKILKETPLFMGGRMILVFHWDPSFDLNTTRTTTAPVWVDLLTLNLVFEDSIVELLGKVGEVVYVASKHARSKFSNVHMCVKVNLTKPLKNYVMANVPEIGVFKIDVEF